MNRDCTMTLTFSNGTHYDCVVVSDGMYGYWIETDPGTVLGVTIIRLGHQE